MDKYRKLLTDIEVAILEIDREIEAKREKINSIGKEIYQTKEYIKEFENQLKEFEEKRKTVAAIANNNIVLFAIKSWLKEIFQEYQEYVKNKNWAITIGFPFLVLCLIIGCSIITLGAGPSGFLLITATLSLMFLGGECGRLIDLYVLKKSYTYEELSEAIEENTKSINQNNEDIKKSQAESKKLHAEVQKLQQDKKYFINCLESVIEKREKALEIVASPKLDELFAREDTSEIITRIRARGSVNNNG